jgi:biopolymer transport protein ExbB/TolQ
MDWEQQVQQIMNAVVYPVLTALAGLVVAWAALKTTQFLNARRAQQSRDNLDETLDHAIMFAQVHLKGEQMSGDVIAEIKRIAYDYVATHGADDLKTMKLDLSTDAGQTNLRQKIESRLAPAVLVSSVSPMSVAAAASMVNPDVPTDPVRIAAKPLPTSAR